TRYFCRILRSLIADHFERAWRLEYRENVPEPSCDPWPEEGERQLVERVCEALVRLPTKDRRSLVAYFGPDDAAQAPGHSRGNMRDRKRGVEGKSGDVVGDR